MRAIVSPRVSVFIGVIVSVCIVSVVIVIVWGICIVG